MTKTYLKNLIAKTRKYNELLYFHTMSIYRLQKVENADGTTDRELVLLASDIPCKLSVQQLQTDNPLNSRKSMTTDVEWKPKVFCRYDVDVKAGDTVEVLVSDKLYKGTASDLMKYDLHHIEFFLGIDKEA